MVLSFRDLDVWNKAMDLVVQVYQVSTRFPADERFGLTSQLRRAAVSIPSNIAEGHARRSRAEYLHHLSIALGSAAEIGTQIELAGRRLPDAPSKPSPGGSGGHDRQDDSRASPLAVPIPQTLIPKPPSKDWRAELDQPGRKLYDELRLWRAKTAKREGLPPYLICNNRQVAAMVATRPTSLAALRDIEGIGEAKAAVAVARARTGRSTAPSASPAPAGTS